MQMFAECLRNERSEWIIQMKLKTAQKTVKISSTSVAKKSQQGRAAEVWFLLVSFESDKVS